MDNLTHALGNILLLATGLVAATLKAATGGAGHEYDGVRIDRTRQCGADELPAVMTVDPSQTVNRYSPRLFGYNEGWVTTNYGQKIFRKPLPVTSPLIPVREEYRKALAEVPLTLVRMSGTDANYLQWKKSIGPAAQREKQKIVWCNTRVLYGPVEWLYYTRLTHPEAEFVWCVNLWSNTPADARDLAEFFTGGPDTVWGKKRIACGLVEPVKPVIWELGNELDWDKAHRMPVDEYIRRCRDTIRAIRSVQPDAVFAAFAASAPWSPARSKNWQEWHRRILAELAPELGYISFHPYYRGMAPKALIPYLATIEKDIRASANPNLGIYLSEHAKWPGSGGVAAKNWKDTWRQGRTLASCLDTAEWLILMLRQPRVKAMSYHCLTGGCAWGLIWQDAGTGHYFTTGLAEMFKLFAAIPWNSDVVACRLDGPGTDWRQNDSSFVAAAVTAERGQKLFLLLNNRLPSTARKVTVRFPDRTAYRLKQTVLLTAPDLEALNTATAHPIRLTATAIAVSKPFTGATVPPRSLLLLTLERLQP